MQLNKKTQSGGVMLETVLAIAVSMAVLVGAVETMKWTQDEKRARNVAEHMQAFQTAAAEYVWARRTDIRGAMASAVAGDNTELAKICLRNASLNASGVVVGTTVFHVAKRTCAFDASYLKALRALPASFSETLPNGERIYAILRIGYKPSTTEQTGDIEMLVLGTVTGTPQANTNYPLVATAANLLGGTGGVIPDAHRGNCISRRSTSTYEVCGMQGGWKLNLADFISPTQLTTFANALPN